MHRDRPEPRCTPRQLSSRGLARGKAYPPADPRQPHPRAPRQAQDPAPCAPGRNPRRLLGHLPQCALQAPRPGGGRAGVLMHPQSRPAARRPTAGTCAARPPPSFRTLLDDLATIAQNRVQPQLGQAGSCDGLPRPTPLQQQALDLRLERTQHRRLRKRTLVPITPCLTSISAPEVRLSVRTVRSGGWSACSPAGSRSAGSGPRCACALLPELLAVCNQNPPRLQRPVTACDRFRERQPLAACRRPCNLAHGLRVVGLKMPSV